MPSFSRLFLLSSSLILCSWAFVSCNESDPTGSAVLVYRGPGSCDDSCSEAAAQIGRMAGLETAFVSASEITPELLKSAKLWIQPGGDSIEAARTLGPKKLAMIREFVARGGAYVGFCAGAFLTDEMVDDDAGLQGLGIIPLTTAYYPADSGSAGTILEVNWAGRPRSVFFNGGATFLLDPAHPVEVLATYQDGDAATISTRYGKGRVVISGLHPEAIESWKSAANRNDSDGNDQDLALDMVRRALGSRNKPVW